MNFIHKVHLDWSKCLSKWIKVDKWEYFQNRPQDFFFFHISISMYFFTYETIVRSRAWSFGYSDSDPSNVDINLQKNMLLKWRIFSWPGKLKRIDKTQNHDLFISPKQKNTVLKMFLKSSIMSKLDHQEFEKK